MNLEFPELLLFYIRVTTAEALKVDNITITDRKYIGSSPYLHLSGFRFYYYMSGGFGIGFSILLAFL